jgi:hypothetical protein
MNDWLYPLSSRSGFRFLFADGSSTTDTSPENFRAAVINGGFADDDWPIATNFHRVESRDRVWIYYGTADGDRGVVGLATITAVEEPREAGIQIFLRWNRRATRRLFAQPFPALEVRSAIWPRGAVHNLSAHPTLVTRMLQQAGVSAPGATSP